MNNAKIIAAASAEIEHPTEGVTKQFLKIHQVVYENNKPVVAGVSAANHERYTAVYFAVEGEKFYFAVYLDLVPEIRITGVDTEDFYAIYFFASSEAMSSEQLAALTTLKPTRQWEKGDIRFGYARWKYSGLRLEPYVAPDNFENKLSKLLDFLEQDANGIRLLADEAGGFIQVSAVFHNGNTWLGGIHLDKKTVQRLAALHLAIDFALHAKGNFYK